MTKIMLVEDDKSLREIYGVRLQAEGYDIKSAGDGEEALAMAIKEKPDLILSDVMMPKISGFDMLDILRSTPETKDIKVIMMTALSSEDQRARGETLGANRYLVKSQVGIEDVVRTVHDLLSDTPGATAFSAPMPTAAIPVTTPETLVTDQPTEQVLDVPISTPIPQPTAPFSTPAPASMINNTIESMAPVGNIMQPQPTEIPANPIMPQVSVAEAETQSNTIAEPLTNTGTIVNPEATPTIIPNPINIPSINPEVTTVPVSSPEPAATLNTATVQSNNIDESNISNLINQELSQADPVQTPNQI